MTYIKRSGGGVALRATFAALIALGSIPGAAAVSPNFSNVAFAATRDSSNQSSDTYIDGLTTAADWQTISYADKKFGFVDWHSNPFVYNHPDNACSYSDLLSELKNQLTNNTEKKEIPVKCSYNEIVPDLLKPSANEIANKFYTLYKKVTGRPKDYGFFTATKFKEFITSKQNNDTDVLLNDKTETLLKKSCEKQAEFGQYRTDKFFVCKIDSSISSPKGCLNFSSSDLGSEYQRYYSDTHDYWANVLSGIRDTSGNLDKTWSFAYNTPTGCELPSRLSDESQRLYDVEGKPKYLVQASFEGYYTRSGLVSESQNEYTGYYYLIQRFSCELPLHTIAKFVKDVTVDMPGTKVPVRDSNALTDNDKAAILEACKNKFLEAMASDKTVTPEVLKQKVDVANGAKVASKNGKILISVDGIKTQVVEASKITVPLDGAITQAKTEIDAAATKKKDELQQKQGTSTDEEIRAAQKKVDDAVKAAKAEIDKAADAKDLDSKKKTALDNINKVTADNAALTQAKQEAAGAVDTAAQQKKQALKDSQGTSTDKEVKDAQDKVDQLANAAKDEINNAADANTVNEKKQAALDNINKVTADNAALTQAKQEAAGAVDTAAQQKKQALKDNQGTSTDKEVKDAQDKVDQLANDAKDEINNAADANTVNEKKQAALDNINKVTADNAALTQAKQEAAGAVDTAAQQKKQALKDNQGTSTDKEVKDAQDKVDQLANDAKDEINNAADANTVNEKKQAALDNINKVTADNAALQNSKKGAKDKLNDYGLSEDEQKPFIKEIDEAKDDKGINDALLKAAKAALVKKIGKATQKQKEIAYTSASSEKKNEFDEKLKAAKDVRDKTGAKIDHITAATEALNTAMDNLDGRAPDTEELYVLHAMYRLYNPYTHEHLFTTDAAEKDNLVSLGWNFEGTVGKVYMHGEKGGVYRLYNPTTGEHHYTTDENELAKCVKAGWKNEGVKFFSVLDTDKQTVGVVSMYNPYEKKFYHHYTSDAGEIAKMVKAGWRKEEIKWYAAK